MDGLDDRTIVLVMILVIFAIITFIELRYFRKRRMAVSKKEPLEDRAFNALLNARAISNTLARDGTDLSGVNEVLGRARAALETGDYRGSLELTDRAKDMMKTVKVKSDAPSMLEGEGEFLESQPTTKEVLKDKFPDNYLESRFSRSLAAEAIERARDARLDVSDAERLLRQCDDCVAVEDYTQALSYAVQSKKAAEGVLSVTKAKAPEAPGNVCRSCGAGIHVGDKFCRKCGAKAILTCNHCGKEPEEGDVFCRGCGARLES
ncbi:MAG: zinc ribbon domain-containing protein [Thermoplasmata archaeon]